MTPLTHLPEVHATWAASIPFIGMALQSTPKLPTIITRLMEVAIVAAIVLMYSNSQKVAIQEVKLEYVIETQQEIKQDVKDVKIVMEQLIMSLN